MYDDIRGGSVCQIHGCGHCRSVRRIYDCYANAVIPIHPFICTASVPETTAAAIHISLTGRMNGLVL